MTRKNLLSDIETTLGSLGFTKSDSGDHYTYQCNVKYPSMFSDKNDYAHFVLYTSKGSIQIMAKFQENTGTAIDKVAYNAMDAVRTPHSHYIVVCGGKEMLKPGRAIDFLNKQISTAPKLQALEAQQLGNYLKSILPPNQPVAA
ncbi:PD-(D/E)XK nuclease superfamily protein [Enterovibrio norvegicus]|uniref:PD-(D/E)XK nuclease superfamily protein n=1 Tax=Enterovibrio norvegicus TaxID=188144 RepID=UPI00352F7077